MKLTLPHALLIVHGFQAPFRKDQSSNEGYGDVLTWMSLKLAAERKPNHELDDLEAM